MLKLSFRAISILSLCLLASCQFQKSEKKKAEERELIVKDVVADIKGEIDTTPPTVIQVNTDSKIDLSEMPRVVVSEPIPDLRPHHYLVKFTWDNKPGNIAKINPIGSEENWPVDTSLPKESKNQFNGKEVNELWFLYNSPGEKKIEVSYFTPGGNHLTGQTFEVKIPEDKVLTGISKLTLENNEVGSFDKKISRVFVDSDYRLYLNGKTLKIYTNQFIVLDDAKIFNFENSTSSQIGGGGGYLNIVANKAKGTLNVDLRGQNGADGAGAPPIAEPAALGAPGKVGHGFDEETNCPDTRCYTMKPKCLMEPTNGLPGADGRNGNAGYDGFRGGDGGNISIKIHEDFTGKDKKVVKFKVKYNVSGGLGGKGGQGSAGQIGGQGGAPGAQGHPTCTPAVAGPNGKNGAPGSDGKRGDNGSNGSLKIDSSKVDAQAL